MAASPGPAQGLAECAKRLADLEKLGRTAGPYSAKELAALLPEPGDDEEQRQRKQRKLARRLHVSGPRDRSSPCRL